jgi:5-methylcytosine-specific restriction endonuclease McrA
MFSREEVEEIEHRLRELNPVQPPRYGSLVKDSIRRTVRAVKWHKEHPQRTRKHKKKYANSEKGKTTASIRRDKRRVIEYNCEGSHTVREWLERKALYGNCCAYCHRQMKHLTKDHIVPLSKGGTNYAHNLVPACGKCNRSKGSNEIFEWDKFKGLQLPMVINYQSYVIWRDK